MALFAKREYKDLMLPFLYIEDRYDLEAGLLSIECYGNVFGEKEYCYASYTLKKAIMYTNGDYEFIKELLKAFSSQKEVLVTFEFKKDKLKDFKIDLNSLAEACGDEKIKFMELSAWGLNNEHYNCLKQHL